MINFKFHKGDRITFGVINDEIVERYISSDLIPIYVLESLSGHKYEVNEPTLINDIKRGKFTYISKMGYDKLSYDWWSTPSPKDFESEKSKTCICESKDLLNYGCKCGYVYQEKKDKEDK